MKLTVNDICGKYKEVLFEDNSIRIESGTLSKDESKELALELVGAASELLSFAGADMSSSMCDLVFNDLGN